MALRAFPVIYARDVEAAAALYERLGFQEGFRMPTEDGSAGFIRLERDGAELGVTTEESPRTLAGVQPGPGPRHELFAYVVDVDVTATALREVGTTIVREPADMFWGERLAYVADPEGNLVVLAGAPIT
ncbi:MAG: VOC family protein [Solirubrobacteraceae bacterium]